MRPPFPRVVEIDNNDKLVISTDITQANLVAAQMYDAVMLYAKALKTAVDNNHEIEDGERLVASMAQYAWTGKNCTHKLKLCKKFGLQ